MYYATTLMGPTGSTPTEINWVLFGYMLTYFPTLALTNTVAMKNMTNPEQQFPRIRVWGTIGWIVAGLCCLSIGLEHDDRDVPTGGRCSDRHGSVQL